MIDLDMRREAGDLAQTVFGKGARVRPAPENADPSWIVFIHPIGEVGCFRSLEDLLVYCRQSVEVR